MSVESNSGIVHAILSFALGGKAWPAGRDNATAEWGDKSESDDDFRLEPLAADWEPDIPPENVVSSEDIQEVLFKAAQINPDTGLPLFPNFNLPIENVRIQGRLWWLGESIPFPIRFRNCIFEDGIHFKDCRLSLLSLKHCRVPFISLKRAVVERSVVIEHCVITHGLNLRGAQIGGLLGLKHSRLSGEGGAQHPSLDLRNAHIGSDVFLRYGFRCDGLVDLSGATIISSLDCGGGQFHCKNNKKTNRPVSLRAKNASVGGSVFLNKGFGAIGEVDFRSAKIGAQMTIRNASFIQNHPAGETRPYFALNIGNATIAQHLILMNILTLKGDIGLQNTMAKTFAYNTREWLKNRKILDGKIWLSGFKYDAVARTRGDIRTSVKWLRTVLPKHYLSKNFVRQPWEQLASALKRNGEYTAANAVLVEATDRSLRQTRHYEKKPLAGVLQRAILFPVRAIFFAFLRYINFGYGFGYLKVLNLLAVLWLINIFTFGSAAYHGRMKPAEEEITVYMEASDNDQTPGYYIQFNALIYSLDLIVPFELGQSSRWTPMMPHDTPLTKEPNDPITHSLNNRLWQKSFTQKLPTIFLWFPKYWSWISVVLGWIGFISIGAAFTGRFRLDKN